MPPAFFLPLCRLDLAAQISTVLAEMGRPLSWKAPEKPGVSSRDDLEKSLPLLNRECVGLVRKGTPPCNTDTGCALDMLL